MKTLEINIDEIKRYPTVTNPIKADDLHTPQAYAYTLRRAIVTDCNDRQRAELVKLLEGKESAEGVTFNNTRVNRDRLHIWQNSESRKERAAILGEGWEYISGLHHGTLPGDLVTCLDGTRGRVTKSDPESCCIEFETADGHRLSVAGYFRYTPSAKSETAITEAEGVKVGDKVRHNKHEEVATVTAIREAFVNRADGYRYLYTLDFGQSVLGPFQVELNGGEFLREAFTLCNPSEIKAAVRLEQAARAMVQFEDSREFTNPDDDRQVLATMEAGRVKFYADWLPLFDILENLGGMPEGDRKQFRCHMSDLYDVVENIGVHINCPHVYLPEDHNALMDMISEAGTDLQHLRAMISVYKAMAKKQDGYVWFEAA